MDNKRQAQFSRLIQKEMSEIFLFDGKALFGKQFISVSQVRVSPDLGYVKIYLSFMNDKEPEKVLMLIREHSKELRTKLAGRIKNQVRKIPELEFFYDDTMDYVEKIDKLFDEINAQPKSKDEVGE
ncbi:MAG: 30S ribosome-binding factor RbfA [Bacteroidetes bacterium]|nr:30S ribosome-binding factor RbfA [Bacteroidota bacterium]